MEREKEREKERETERKRERQRERQRERKKREMITKLKEPNLQMDGLLKASSMHECACGERMMQIGSSVRPYYS